MKYLKVIQDYYGDQKAKRSGVPYINHIYEGLDVLRYLGAQDTVLDAYALHPIFQDDETLEDNLYHIWEIDKEVLVLCMEYRNVANRGLNCYQIDNPAHIYLGPLSSVRTMLIADKVQNRKDFLTYHLGSHPKSIELDIYFKNWLRALEINEATYNKLCEIIEYGKIYRELNNDK